MGLSLEELLQDCTLLPSSGKGAALSGLSPRRIHLCRDFEVGGKK